MRERLLWGALAIVAYTYVVFPLIVIARGVLRPRPVRARQITPSVTLVVAARNEEVAIASKLENLDRLDYPEDLLEVVIASDGSEDATERIVEAHRGRPVTLLRLPRRGKAPALNAAVARSSGEIVVFTDANSRLAPDAIRHLTAPFADPGVGGVAGNQVYASDDGVGSRAEGERAYWNFDRLLKLSESRAGNTISATGALYAVRRGLIDQIPDGVTDDFYTSVGVISKGHRLVFAPRAVAYERPSRSGGLEFRRKVRIMTRGLAAIRARRELLDPRVHGFYSVQLASHKLLRRLMGAPLVVAAVLAPTLWRRGATYRVLAVAQTAFYGLAMAGMIPWRGARMRVFSVPAFVCSSLAASALATLNTLRGRRIDRWEPIHDDEASEE
jgi:glycosyltransferase involved in cell wall biosynthesis